MRSSSVASRVTKRGREFLDFLRGSSGVTVGIHEGDGSEAKDGSDLTVADVASFHEFGLGVPERSWLRGFVDEEREKLLKMVTATSKRAAEGADKVESLDRLGLAVAGMMKERIKAGINPELAESTKEQKRRITGGNAKDTPLILFGQLISSISHEII